MGGEGEEQWLHLARNKNRVQECPDIISDDNFTITENVEKGNFPNHIIEKMTQTYSPKTSRSCCSEQSFSKFATNNVEQGIFPARSPPNSATCSGPVGEPNAGKIGWC